MSLLSTTQNWHFNAFKRYKILRSDVTLFRIPSTSCHTISHFVDQLMSDVLCGWSPNSFTSNYFEINANYHYIFSKYMICNRYRPMETCMQIKLKKPKQRKLTKCLRNFMKIGHCHILVLVR